MAKCHYWFCFSPDHTGIEPTTFGNLCVGSHSHCHWSYTPIPNVVKLFYNTYFVFLVESKFDPRWPIARLEPTDPQWPTKPNIKKWKYFNFYDHNFYFLWLLLLPTTTTTTTTTSTSYDYFYYLRLRLLLLPTTTTTFYSSMKIS